MENKTLSEKALGVIDQYRNFHLGEVASPIPYYNNKHIQLKSALKVQVGKGNPKEILEEVENLCVMEKCDLNSLDSSSLRKFLIDHNIGIDCSGFAYYILEAESLDRGKGKLDKLLHFNKESLFSKFKIKMQPEKNTDVQVLANDDNSKEINLNEVRPGDIVTMIGESNHILVIYKVEYKNNIPFVIHYTHAIAWPSDGKYGHGVREGLIKIIDINKTIIEQEWIENGKIGAENYTFSRTGKSTTTLRRPLFL